MNIIIYSKENCPYCESAKKWFRSKSLTFVEHTVGKDGFTREALLEAVPGARTVPQIIINGELVGGWDDLKKHRFFTEL